MEGDLAERKQQLHTDGASVVRVIDGLLSGVVNILKIGYIKSVDFSPTLQAERMKSQAFDKAGPPFLLIYTHIP